MKNEIQLLCAVLLSLLLGACATEHQSSKETFLEEWQIRAEDSPGFSPPEGPDLRFSITKSLDLGTGEELLIEDMEGQDRVLPTMIISNMVLREAVDIGVVLRSMAIMADQSIFFSEKVKGPVRFTLNTPEPWDQVFKGILSSHSLIYEWEGNIIRVMTLADISNDLEVRRILEQQNEVENAKKRVETLRLATIHVNYANATNLTKQLRALLTENYERDGQERKRGSVEVDDFSNTIVINAIEADIEKMLSLAKTLDRPTPQVLIEAFIVEANKETARQLGIQWGGLYSGVDGNNLVSVNPGANPNGFMADFPSTFIPGAESGLTAGFLMNRLGQDQMLRIQLSALEEDGLLNILSTPSITTLDNQTAYIESGKEVPYQVISGTGESKDLTTEWKKALLRLEVTPNVIDDRTLKLKIITNKDELDETNIDEQGLPQIITKKAETSLILFDGQTTVIGGLSKESTRKKESGIPWLSKIPILGYLFKGINHGTAMEDLLIFITPHILEKKMYGPEDLEEDLDR